VSFYLLLEECERVPGYSILLVVPMYDLVGDTVIPSYDSLLAIVIL
jgi:hypothetical protein